MKESSPSTDRKRRVESVRVDEVPGNIKREAEKPLTIEERKRQDERSNKKAWRNLALKVARKVLPWLVPTVSAVLFGAFVVLVALYFYFASQVGNAQFMEKLEGLGYFIGTFIAGYLLRASRK